MILPPISLQTQFSQIAEKVEALKEQFKNSLKDLENEFLSLGLRFFILLASR